MSTLKRARRVCFAAAGVLTLVSMVGFASPGRAQTEVDENARPTSWGAYAAAAGIHEGADGNAGLTPVIEPIYGNLPDAISTFGPDVNHARASAYYPGQAAINGPSLLCGVKSSFPPPFDAVVGVTCQIPPYAFSTEAPAPDGKPDSSIKNSQNIGQGPVAATAVSASAHADRAYVSANGTTAGFNSANGSSSASSASVAAASLAFRRQVALILQGPLAASQVQSTAADSVVVHADSTTATTRDDFDKANPAELIVTAHSEVHGVALLGGTVKIDSIVADSRYVTDGRTVKSHVDTVTVNGATAGGQPATIDQNGITINGSGQGKPVIDALNAALNTALAASGSHVHVLSPSGPVQQGQPPAGLSSQAFGRSCSQGEADGVELYTQVDASKVPNGQVIFDHALLGGACTDAYASAERGVAGAGDTGGDAGTGDTSGGDASATVAAPAAAPSDLGSTTASPSVANGPTTGTPRVATPRRVSSGGLLGLELDRGSIELLYVAGSLAFIGLCLGSKFAVPARLPRHR